VNRRENNEPENIICIYANASTVEWQLPVPHVMILSILLVLLKRNKSLLAYTVWSTSILGKFKKKKNKYKMF